MIITIFNLINDNNCTSRSGGNSTQTANALTAAARTDASGSLAQPKRLVITNICLSR